jgi:hypothetical protein
MKNKLLITLAIILIIFLVYVRINFNKNFVLFKNDINKIENLQYNNFLVEKNKELNKLKNGNLELYHIFLKQFKDSNSIIIKDTSYSYFYLSKIINYNFFSSNYIECFISKCYVDLENLKINSVINSKINHLKSIYGETFSIWYPKFKDEKLLKYLTYNNNCSDFKLQINKVVYDSSAWFDFENFLNFYDIEVNKSNTYNDNIDVLYSQNVASAKMHLSSNYVSYLDNKLQTNLHNIITTQDEIISFNSVSLGIINFSVSKKVFNTDAFQTIIDDVDKEQWSSYSLVTGSTPYANCYGSNNSCYSNFCSRITVSNGSNDALVLIKNNFGYVIRHGYIRASNTFSFDLPDGAYTVYFYTGNGWNPYKNMNSTNCINLKGGFVYNEDVTKVNSRFLSSQEWTIELILQKNGNLQTQQSSKDEAL